MRPNRQSFDQVGDGTTAVVHKPHIHDSARLHVQGAAPYIDDIREPIGTLHLAAGLADKARGTLRALDLAAVRAAPGVVAVFTAADLAMAPVWEIAMIPEEFAQPPLAVDVVRYAGERVAAVVATSAAAAADGAEQVVVEYVPEAALYST